MSRSSRPWLKRGYFSFGNARGVIGSCDGSEDTALVIASVNLVTELAAEECIAKQAGGQSSCDGTCAQCRARAVVTAGPLRQVED